MKDLELLTTTTHGYLTPKTSSYIIIYLYTIYVDDHGIWFIFVLVPKNETEYNVKLDIFEFEG